MSTNGVNVEDAEMAECDGEKVVTMMDVLQEQQEFEEDANAVLGASDDKNCTYNKGYIKRQALYACLTCCSEAREDPTKRAGVCLACSLTCHENHDLVELYTKRNFCCDCGNPKFNHPCQYTPNKKELNDENKYNQNFSGLYCTCHRPYPDPDGVEEEMIQCIVCEDWLHASHLEATVPSSDAYAEMICKGCMEKNDFLHDYSRYAVNGDVDVSINESDISICNGDTSKLNGVDEVEKEHDNKEEVTNLAVEKSKESEEVAGDSAGKLTDITDLAESENHSICNDDNKDEQIEPKITDLESTNVDKPEESEDKPKESSVSEETTVEKDLKEQNETSNEDTEEAKDQDQKKEESSLDNAEVLASNDTKDETDIEQKLEENPVPTNETDINTEEAAGQVSKDEIEPKTNETEPETNKEDTNGIPDDRLVGNHENQKDSAEPNTIDAVEKDIELDESSKVETNKEETNGISDNQPVDSQETEKDAAGQNTNDSVEKDIEMDESSKVETNKDDTNGIPDDLPVGSQVNEKDSAEPNSNDSVEKDVEMNESSKVEENHSEDQTKENKRKFSTEDAVDVTSVKKPKLEGSKCARPRNERKVFKGATFWPSHFRQKLCTCNECIAMYKDLAVLFLIDPEDTVSAYEVLGKERTDGTASTQYEKGLEALSSLGRIQQINALTEYNKMRDKLLDFLKSFKDRKEVVKEDDIKAFFAGMKPKREPDGVYFCK